jgi:DNA invertase Pin-like site-specific DNA recombinase
LLLFSSIKDLLFTILDIKGFELTSPMDEAVFQRIAVLKAMEIEVLHERTIDGLKAARTRGKKGGRKPGSYNKERAVTAAAL